MDLLEKFLQSKPTREINSIISVVEQHSSIIETFKNKVMFFDVSSECILLCEGRIILLDEERNQICPVNAPLVLGLKGCFHYDGKVIFRCHEDTVVKKVNVSKLDSVLTEKNCWRDAAHILSFYNAFLLFFSTLIRNPSSSPLVRVAATLLALDELQNKKSQDFVASSIINHTLLSRSAVMKCLKYLKDKNVVTTSGGVLGYVDRIKLSQIIKGDVV